ncbi:hypothetical protein [Bradyrhizobium sp. Ai1a-2]|uniref:hypothetical protein n=1 Tax=Bradyrhizobium sp. Ai1a-2 TaxID=196490 RepID=UPI00041E2582|nr:hypothetical protein [Bradyrhizobium sp. Ai1a-2]
MSVFSGVIANGGSISGAIPIGDKVITGIVMPAGWDAAALTFQVSIDGGVNWSNLFDSSGNEVAFQAAASRFIAVDPTLWIGINHIKIRSGTAAAAVNQNAERSVRLVGQ